jgi:type 1 fimbriae regulatory protein FimE
MFFLPAVFPGALAGGDIPVPWLHLPWRVLSWSCAGDRPRFNVSERGGPLTARAVRHLVLRAGEVAGLTFPIHPHMLRHAYGFYLAHKGIDTRAIQQYLGHCNMQHTVRYTALTPYRFTQFWDD